LIESTIKYAETILGRKLTGEELILMGVAFQDGYIQGLKKGGKLDDGKK
jgi:hypothetical protein